MTAVVILSTLIKNLFNIENYGKENKSQLLGLTHMLVKFDLLMFS